MLVINANHLQRGGGIFHKERSLCVFVHAHVHAHTHTHVLIYIVRYITGVVVAAVQSLLRPLCINATRAHSIDCGRRDNSSLDDVGKKK